VRHTASCAVASFGEAAVAPLISTLDDADPHARESALESLGTLGDAARGAVERMILALDDRSTRVREQARQALERIDCPRAREAADRFDDDEQARIRAAVEAAERDAQRILSRDEVRAALPGAGVFRHVACLHHWVELHLPPAREFFLAVHRGRARPDRLTVWTNAEGGYRRLLERESLQDLSGQFDEPNVFRFAGRELVQIQHRSCASGQLHEQLLFALEPDGQIVPVEYVSPTEAYIGWLEPGETVWRRERTLLADESMTFEFFIWDEGVGLGAAETRRVRGLFDLVDEPREDGRPMLRLEPVTFERE
jgi:hypothetical protein